MKNYFVLVLNNESIVRGFGYYSNDGLAIDTDDHTKLLIPMTSIKLGVLIERTVPMGSSCTQSRTDEAMIALGKKKIKEYMDGKLSEEEE